MQKRKINQEWENGNMRTWTFLWLKVENIYIFVLKKYWTNYGRQKSPPKMSKQFSREIIRIALAKAINFRSLKKQFLRLLLAIRTIWRATIAKERQQRKWEPGSIYFCLHRSKYHDELSENWLTPGKNK